jgi:hypothetical protein
MNDLDHTAAVEDLLTRAVEAMLTANRYRAALEDIVTLGDSWHIEHQLAVEALGG